MAKKEICMKMRKIAFLMLIAVAAAAQQTPNVPSANQSINIQAVFSPENRTYFYRDTLNITVTADKNCYFKVIYIDADNQMTMIYPNPRDRNNELKANTPRAIFENEKISFWGPYGTETIAVVASAEQFVNIEREYNAPLVQTAKTGESEARYTITILKPDEEYEYTLPENMAEIIQTMRRDALAAGGTFEGNERSGFYILNSVRGSYLVASDTIQFAFYILDEKNAGVQARGSTYNFSFTKPQNIAQAVQTVRSGIESKGGMFSGNDQQGNFKAEGIAGQYNVSDYVNVTITEKPFIIPNSLIEKEIKNFFGVK
jgi:hypothetical protein